MTFDAHTNLAYGEVATGPSPATSGTSLTVTAGQGAMFPAAPFNATIWPSGVQPLASNAEIVRVTAISTDTFTIVRAQEGTSARTVEAGDQIAATITAMTLTDVEDAIPNSTADLPDSTDARYVTDADLVVLGDTSGVNTGDQTSVSGNAGTATKFATARNIDGQSFDGSADVTVVAPGTHAASSKTTPVDADELSLVDSAASNVLKKLTWANLKATAKSYFDTLYSAIGATFFVGTTSIANNRASAAQALTGITSIDGLAATATKLATARAIDGQDFDGSAAITVIAPGTHAATSKTTPVDADEIPLVDSAASNVLKKLTWANVKATLKTYFDTLYVSSTGAVTSVFTRTGAVVATTGDYTAAQVTNAADKISTSIQSFAGGYRSSHATAVSGYATGAGGAVTQVTSRTTAVTCDHPTGRITTFNSSMAASAVASFTVNCSVVGSTDTVIINCVNDVTTSGAPIPPYVGQVAAGTFVITYYNNSSGSSSSAFVFNYSIIHAVAS